MFCFLGFRSQAAFSTCALFLFVFFLISFLGSRFIFLCFFICFLGPGSQVTRSICFFFFFPSWAPGPRLHAQCLLFFLFLFFAFWAPGQFLFFYVFLFFICFLGSRSQVAFLSSFLFFVGGGLQVPGCISNVFSFF